MSNSLTIEERPGGLLAVKFIAMACPCEVLLRGIDRTKAMGLGAMAAHPHHEYAYIWCTPEVVS